MKTTGKISVKEYRCTHCGNVAKQSTNHWGETYGSCSACSWKRPGQATVHECLEALPEGYAKPEPWKIVRLGDICTVMTPTS